MFKLDGEDQGTEDSGERLTLGRSVARAVELGVRLHRESSPVHRMEEGAASLNPEEAARLSASAQILPPRVLAEVIAWLGAQWADTWSFDYEAASARFEIPADLLRSEVSRFLRGRAGYGNSRRN